jgi:glutamyl-Q tRNA(Asp) synthetase
MGSLVTALASFCDIKQRGGDWFVRIDDIDPLRIDPNALEHITKSLAAHGLSGDGPMQLQSHRLTEYAAARDQLADLCYFCNCSRKQLQGGRLYPGYCRHKQTFAPDHAVRITADHKPRQFLDRHKGPYPFVANEHFGDFIIWRRDDLVTYHLATAYDDGHTHSHVLRGEDLFEMTAPQLFLMENLGLNPPEYTHIPVLAFPDGTKLSKRTHAPALNTATPEANLRNALHLLGQQPPKATFSVGQWLDWAITYWRFDAIPQALAPFSEADYD